ncbi:MAG: GNAT family N-acetyltransferase, partial [Janthinobacterium lividum]
MHDRWPLSMDAMLETLSGVGLLLVAEAEGRRLGFCAINYRRGGPAGLILLLVEPSHQRCGIGTALLRMAVRTL